MKTKYKLITILGLATILTGVTAAFEGGVGSSSNPYQISTCQQLQDMQNDLDESYELVSNVDCSTYTGFSSVGADNNAFTGVLDGRGYVVENLTISGGYSDSLGLIGYLDDGGEVKDIGVINVDISRGTYHVGGLVGYNHSGSVSSSFSTGSVSGSDRVGGLIGQAFSNSFSSVYWDNESSGQSSSGGAATGLTMSEMQGNSAETNMDDFGFSSNWTSVLSSESDTTSDGYPILQSLNRTAQLKAQGIYEEPPISLSVDWSRYSSNTNLEGFRIYYGVDSIDESNMVEVSSSADSRQISDNIWTTGDNICVEVRPYNSNGEASSDEQCVTLT